MQKFEQISALHDNAGSPEDLAALPQIVADPASRAVWARFQALTDLLDASEPVFTGDSLQRRVAAALADEPIPALTTPTATVVTLPAPRPARHWPGLAVAASVLMAALTGWYLQTSQQPGGVDTGLPLAERTVPAQPLPGDTEAPPPTIGAPLAAVADPAQVSSLPPEEYQRRINSYLVNFNEQRAQMGAPGVHPYVRVVGFENAPQP